MPRIIYTVFVLLLLVSNITAIKPNEIIYFSKLYPKQTDSFIFLSSRISKAHKTFIFPNDVRVSIVDIIPNNNSVLFYQVSGSKKQKSSVLKFPIDLSRGEPMFYSHYDSSLNWMVYKSSLNNSEVLILVEFGDKEVRQFVSRTKHLSTFNRNYESNKMSFGKSSPFGCYLVEHIIEEKSDGVNDAIEDIWFCDKPIKSKTKLLLIRK